MLLAARASTAQESSTCISDQGRILNAERTGSGLLGVTVSRIVFTPNGGKAKVTWLPFLTGNRPARSFSSRSVSTAATIRLIKGNATVAVVAVPCVSLNRAMKPAPLASAGLIVLHTIFGWSMRTKLEARGKELFFFPTVTFAVSGFSTSQPNWSALPCCQPPSWLRIDQLNRTGPC